MGDVAYGSEYFQAHTVDADTFEAKSEKKWNMPEVGEMLMRQVPGCLIIDLDFTLKPKEYEMGLGGKEPGRIPDSSMELLKRLKEKGWEILVVTNQPKEGHQVARTFKKLTGGKYPIFPDDLEELLGENGVAGAGDDFLTNKYKASVEGVFETANWLEERMNKKFGNIFFVGDRETDADFAQRVKLELEDRRGGKVLNKIVNILTVDGMNLPSWAKPLIP